MKKILISMALIIAVGCGNTSHEPSIAKAEFKSGTYLESYDKMGSLEAMVIIDKATGCRFQVTKSYNSNSVAQSQIFNKDGKPDCIDISS